MTDLNVEEIKNNIELDHIRKNGIVVSNIVEVISTVVINVAGKDIADTIGEQNLTRNIVNLSIVDKLKEKLFI